MTKDCVGGGRKRGGRFSELNTLSSPKTKLKMDKLGNKYISILFCDKRPKEIKRNSSKS